MSSLALKRSLAQGETNSKIHWSAPPQEAIDHLQNEHGIIGEEAELMVTEALTLRRKEIRKTATINLIISAIVLAIPVAYFAIQGFVGFVRIGFEPIFMASVGLGSFLSVCRNFMRIMSGTSDGSAH